MRFNNVLTPLLRKFNISWFAIKAMTLCYKILEGIQTTKDGVQEDLRFHRWARDLIPGPGASIKLGQHHVVMPISSFGETYKTHKDPQ